MHNPFSRSKCFPFIRLDLALHIVPWIRYLGFTTRGKKGPLTTTGELSACKSAWTLTRIYTVNTQALKDRRVVPALGTIDHASGRARVVLFRVVPRAANRARPIWNSIVSILHEVGEGAWVTVCFCGRGGDGSRGCITRSPMGPTMWPHSWAHKGYCILATCEKILCKILLSPFRTRP
jgi:hypothetical protein